jgi:hypothetical protein
MNRFFEISIFLDSPIFGYYFFVYLAFVDKIFIQKTFCKVFRYHSLANPGGTTFYQLLNGMDIFEERERLKRKWERCNKKGEFKINESERKNKRIQKSVNQAGSVLLRMLEIGSGSQVTKLLYK